jgi:alkylated DNA repair dioxygenase AlkB
MYMDLFSKPEEPSFETFVLGHGEVLFMEDFLNPTDSEELFHKLRDTIQWGQEYLNIYGKKIPFPRQTAWYGDQGTDYMYSKKLYHPLPWIPKLLQIKSKLERVYAEERFKSVLLNRYRNGMDKVSWHSDDEKAFGKNPTIASVSLGATRRFDLRYKPDKTKIYHFELTPGSLLIMKGELQSYWEHQVPQQKNITGERINLTFRKVERADFIKPT